MDIGVHIPITIRILAMVMEVVEMYMSTRMQDPDLTVKAVLGIARMDHREMER